MLDPVGRHQVIDEQVPRAALHEELDRPEVVIEEVGQRPQGVGLVAAVVDDRVPRPVRPAEVGLQRAQEL